MGFLRRWFFLDRRNERRRELEYLKADILYRLKAHDCDNGTARRIQALLEEGARRLGLDLPSREGQDTRTLKKGEAHG